MQFELLLFYDYDYQWLSSVTLKIHNKICSTSDAVEQVLNGTCSLACLVE